MLVRVIDCDRHPHVPAQEPHNLVKHSAFQPRASAQSSLRRQCRRVLPRPGELRAHCAEELPGEQTGCDPVSVQHDEVEVVARGPKRWGQVHAKRRASCRTKHPHIRGGLRGAPSHPCAPHPPQPSWGGGGRQRG